MRVYRPFLFSVGEAGEYKVGSVRYLIFAAQIVMFLMTSIYTLVVTSRSRDDSFDSVFRRADSDMYRCKKHLKEMKAITADT